MAWGLSLLLALTQHCDNMRGSHQNTGNGPERAVWDFSTTWVSPQSWWVQVWQPSTELWDCFVHCPCLFSPDPSCLHHSSDSSKLSHQPAKVLLILLRMLSISSPAEQQGIFQLQAALETFAVHQPPHHHTYHLQHRGFWWNWSLSYKWPVWVGRCHWGHVRVGNCPQFFSLDPSQRHFLGLLLWEKATPASLSLETDVS